MNILMLTFDYVPSPVWGMGTNVNETVKGLRRRGHLVTVVTVNRFGLQLDAVTVDCTFDVKQNCRIGKCQCDIDDKSCLSALYNTTVEFIEKNGIHYDIIHCHGWMMWDMAKKLSIRYGLPIVSTIHFLDEMYDIMGIKMACSSETIARIRGVESDMIHHSDKLISISHFADTLLSTIYPMAAPHSIVYHGVHDREHSRKERSRRFLFVGRLTPEKGVNQLYEIFSSQPQYSLDIIGAGTLIPPHECKNIHYLGQYPQEELFRIMEGYDFLILPYLYELFGLVMIEGISCGCIPIIANEGCLKELSDYFMCLKFSLDKNIVVKDSVIEAVEFADRMPQWKIAQYRAHNYTVFAKLFSTDKMIDNIYSVYREVLKS